MNGIPMPGPRHDADVERLVLGSAMLDHRVIDDCDVHPEDFYRPEHEALWSLIRAEHQARRPTDPVAILQRVVASEIRGVDAAYLHGCVAAVPTAVSAPVYANMVRELARLRRMAEVGQRMIEQAATADWDAAPQVLEATRAQVDAIAATTDADRGVRTFWDALDDAMDGWDKLAPGLASGWPDVDSILNGGWRPGHLTIMGARPTVGKSMVGGVTAYATAELGHGTGIFSLEMSEAEIVGRITAHAAGVDLSRIEKHQLHKDDWHRVAELHNRVFEWPLFVDDRHGMSMGQIRAKVRTWTRRHPLKLVIVDYVQLVTPADPRANREAQVSAIARELKLLAREFDLHVLALAQVNRNPLTRADKRPTMGDLRESGGLEAHADNVILLHRDDEECPGELELLVEKNRHGRTGKVVLAWLPHVASARSLSNERWTA